MKKLELLTVGCSFTADCGFTDENRKKYHWPELFAKNFNYNLNNHAIGGMSNEEIFYRTIHAITKNDYDLVIVMWSSLHRKWLYFNENNVDDFVSANFGSNNNFAVQEFAKVYYAYFSNHYIEIKKWLLSCIALQEILNSKKIKWRFARGFNNHIDEFSNINYKNNAWSGNTTPIKRILDWENRPDEYLHEKILDIQYLIKRLQKDNWINLYTSPFNQLSTDVADDNQHPGPEANKIFLQDLIDSFEKLQ